MGIKTIDYHIIGTGSKGNAVRIENIMIDCGVSFSKMKDDLYKCDTLLITHAHSDHIKTPTLDRIRREFPRIRVYANYDVAYLHPIDKVIGTKPFKLKRNNVTVYPFDGLHDVPVTGFVIDFDGTKVFYATDTCEVENPINDKLDYVFCEANYDETILREVGKRYIKRGYDPFDNAKRHLSLKQCKEFYFSNRRSKDSPLIELHMSERFR